MAIQDIVEPELAVIQDTLVQVSVAIQDTVEPELAVIQDIVVH